MKRLGFLGRFGAAVIAASLYPVDFVLRYTGKLMTQEEVHQIIYDIIEPYTFEQTWSPSIKEEIEQALSPLESRVVVDPTHILDSKVHIYYRLPTDEPVTFRHAEIGMVLGGIINYGS